jgi:hypothetical protein
MASLVYVELLGNPRYRKFLHGAFPWIGHVGIKHFFMAPLVTAEKNTRSGIVDFFVTEETAWTSNVWIRPLLVRNVDRLMYKLSKFLVCLLRFAKPEMLITDYEWAEACIKDGQFIGKLVVTPSFYLLGAQQHFDYFVRVRLTRPRRENAVPSLKQSVTMKLKFGTIPIGQPGQVLASALCKF